MHLQMYKFVLSVESLLIHLLNVKNVAVKTQKSFLVQVMHIFRNGCIPLYRIRCYVYLC